ncbi:lysophospholipid acyltransferase family protein [Pseudodesulfovibrio pelocollis]|uniref:lysophospholipid acyltransferase family protein n=1 Tax=Pseudodesulfovibrio pelocollis TaxID=3051432 RepID=UPI00255AA2DC|nr:lysophospholipid acyltransferase family protein [Pseudodesulfovibrio sp. SB368]
MQIPIDPVRLAPFTALLFKAWIRSMRFTVSPNLEEILALNRGGQRLVIALWHDELFSIAGYGCVNISGLLGVVSQSTDGQFVAGVMESLGQTTVRGSSSRGGMRALLQAKHVMRRENLKAVFAVDGPCGPRHEPKDGAVFLARHAGAMIVPIRAFPARSKVFANAWDRFQLPYPLTRCRMVVGEPYAVTPGKLDADALTMERARLKEKLDALT